jgi:Tfp pilus assembly protein PilV
MSRSGLTIIEVLVSVTIISLALLPILYMASRNVETARLDRVRVAAEAICHNVLERFGRAEDNAASFLEADPGEPGTYTGTDIWNKFPHLRPLLGIDRVAVLMAQAKMEVTLTLKARTAPGMDTLSCKVAWVADPNVTKRPESISYERFVLRDHR